MPTSAQVRQRNLEQLRDGTLDVFILGGGINGAGIARDLALRARRAQVDLRIGLVEKGHFASGTSGKNSQLIHGGLRYLKYLEFGLVREALRERATLLEIAPHLVEPLPFLIPMYGHFERVFYGTGLWLYDALAGERSIGRRRQLSRSEVSTLEPQLNVDEVVSGAVFFDCRVHSARFVLENVLEAASNGAAVANYVEAESFVRAEDGAWRIHLVDRLARESFVIRARKLVDAVGPWGTGLRLVRGSHIVLPRLNASDNAIAYFDEDGRIVFLIPWGTARDLTLVGTTDVDHDGGPDRVKISAAETDYLLGIAGRLYPAARGMRPIAAYSALRPLVADGSDSPTSTSREHRIWTSEDGVVHVAGGKYTTYRAMSEEAADLTVREIAPSLDGVHHTEVTPLNGNSRQKIEKLLARCEATARDSGISVDEARQIVRDYGVNSTAVLERLPVQPPDGLSRLRTAEIARAACDEMVQRLPDLLFVSTYWGYEQTWTAETLQPYALELGRHFGWDKQRVKEEVELCLSLTEAHT